MTKPRARTQRRSGALDFLDVFCLSSIPRRRCEWNLTAGPVRLDTPEYDAVVDALRQSDPAAHADHVAMVAGWRRDPEGVWRRAWHGDPNPEDVPSSDPTAQAPR